MQRERCDIIDRLPVHERIPAGLVQFLRESQERKLLGPDVEEVHDAHRNGGRGLDVHDPRSVVGVHPVEAGASGRDPDLTGDLPLRSVDVDGLEHMDMVGALLPLIAADAVNVRVADLRSLPGARWTRQGGDEPRGRWGAC